VQVEEAAVEAAEAVVKKLSGKLKEEAEKKLEEARKKLQQAEAKLQADLEETIQNEGKVDWEKAGLKSYFERGWPHPNARGHALIASKILAALGVKGGKD
jgi:exonuclease VII large subunit